jgi:hypothetical protein
MPLPVITDIWQVKFVYSSPSVPREATNDFYVKDTTGGLVGPGVFALIDANVTASMFQFMPASASVITVRLTPLDGVSAGVDFATGSPAKWSGTATGDIIPQGAAVLTLRTALGGRSFRGRLYLPWVTEASQANGVLLAAAVSGLSSAWTTYGTALSAASLIPQVVSKRLGVATEVTNYVGRPFLRTQRRRALR